MHPRELLDFVLSEGRCPKDSLDALLAGRWRAEGQWHDYKSAEGLVPKKRDAVELRKDAAAFANADGGLLIFGVEDDLSFGQAPSKGAAQWITSALTPAMSWGLPLFRVVDEQGYIVVAVPRAPQLVAHSVQGRPAYYVRVHDQTVEAPEFLVNDLLLGRRQQPAFQIQASVQPRGAGNRAAVGLRVECTNVSPVWVEEILVVLLAPSEEVEWPTATAAFAEAVERFGTEVPVRQWRMRLKAEDAGASASFPEAPGAPPLSRLVGGAVAKLPRGFQSGTWLAAIAVIPKGSPPQFFQVEVPTVLDHDASGVPLFNGQGVGGVTVTPTWPGRPRVGWDELREPIVVKF